MIHEQSRLRYYRKIEGNLTPTNPELEAKNVTRFKKGLDIPVDNKNMQSDHD